MTAKRCDDLQTTRDEPAVVAPISRRAFLRGALATAGAALLAACAPRGPAERPLAAPYNTATPARVLASPPPPVTGTPLPAGDPPQAGAIPLEQFLMLSAVLTGVANLDPVVGSAYLQSLQAGDEFDVSLSELAEQAGFGAGAAPASIDELEANGVFAGEATAALADKIIEYWYTGVYTTPEGEPAVATFVDALAWKALTFTKPNSICADPGFWEKRPEAEGF